LEDYPTLGVSEECPGDVTVFELVDGDFTSESAVGLIEDVLGSDLKRALQVFTGKEEVECWWCDDDL
jgi:hypothetical protein